MNTIHLNTIGERVIVKGDGHASGGGFKAVGDGKTYLHISVVSEARCAVPLVFSQTMDYGVTIDWGDGSVETPKGNSGQLVHDYARVGDYVISLDVHEDCAIELGYGSSSRCVMGKCTYEGLVYCAMLKFVEIGNRCGMKPYAFYNCRALHSIVIPHGVNIPNSAFSSCNSLASVNIPKGITSISNSAFSYCNTMQSVTMQDGLSTIVESAFSSCDALPSIKFPSSVTTIGRNAFNSCRSLRIADFSQHTEVPVVGATAFAYTADDCKIVVPDALFDAWVIAENWSTYSTKIIKKSEWDAM